MLLPFRAELVGTNPIVLEVLNGSTEASEQLSLANSPDHVARICDCVATGRRPAAGAAVPPPVPGRGEQRAGHQQAIQYQPSGNGTGPQAIRRPGTSPASRSDAASRRNWRSTVSSAAVRSNSPSRPALSAPCPARQRCARRGARVRRRDSSGRSPRSRRCGPRCRPAGIWPGSGRRARVARRRRRDRPRAPLASRPAPARMAWSGRLAAGRCAAARIERTSAMKATGLGGDLIQSVTAAAGAACQSRSKADTRASASQ